jgi:hypothetical protein
VNRFVRQLYDQIVHSLSLVLVSKFCEFHGYRHIQIHFLELLLNTANLSIVSTTDLYCQLADAYYALGDINKASDIFGTLKKQLQSNDERLRFALSYCPFLVEQRELEKRYDLSVKFGF